MKFAWLISSSLMGILAGLPLRAGNASVAIENAALRIEYDPVPGHFSVSTRMPAATFLTEGQLSVEGGDASVQTVQHPVFGAGQAIVVDHADGGRDTIELFPGLPFALFRATVHNGGAGPKIADRLQPWHARAEIGRPAAELTTLGSGGLLPPEKNPGSYVWLALVDPQNRRGIVAGWLTDTRGSGVVFSPEKNDQVRLDAQLDYGRLQLAPGATEELETFAIGCFDDARLGLEAWADAVAAERGIHLRPQPAGYCTWYSEPYGAAADEKHLAELAEFAAKNLAPFGFSIVQIDDHWQAGVSHNGPKRNFTTNAQNGPYPSGMKAAADHIRSLGLTPGIWFMPFAGTYYDPFFKDHQDWFVKTQSGEPYETKWGGTCLDMTDPGAREHLRDVAHRITNDWGFGYVKVDGLWTGSGTKLMYINTGYADDGMGDAVFHDPDKTNVEIFRGGLKLLREAVGDRTFILGCNTPQNMRTFGAAMGLVDAMRIGPDNKANWADMLRGPTFGSRYYFLNGRVWYNDPDPVYVRPKIPLEEARALCSWVAISGQLNLSSEWLPGLPPERLDILKRTMPSHGLRPRPADLFEQPIPRLWLLTDTRTEVRRNVIGIFNWDDKPAKIDYALDRLGLTTGVRYAAFDYWQNILAPALQDRLKLTVPPRSCIVLAVRPEQDHPQLLSTSRHITQGMVDVIEERWDPQAKTLHGRSKVVGGDPYELRIAADSAAWTADAVEVTAADRTVKAEAAFKQEPGLVRVALNMRESGEVAWAVKFK
ncbi:MAG TPA: glycoside hydrolase family 36 protein [Opitutaceae bacterium]|nr:glycoside hydrolase family 36 protein [Opitutaceae bacterium]